MTDLHLVIIGSGPAGVGAARAFLDADGGRVTILSSDIDPPYERPPLSKSVLAGAAPAEGTPIDGRPLPDEVDLRLGTTVTAIDPAGHTVTAGGEQVGYDRLVIAVGSRVRGLDDADPDAEVFTLRSLDDARRLDQAARHARSALVIGSGFIGCEAAAALATRGRDVTLVTPEDGPQRNRLGEFAAEQIRSWLIGLGVEVRTGVQVTGIRAPRTVHLDDGTTLAPDLIVLAVGVEPAADRFEGSGLQLHEGRVVTDEHLNAADDIWVAGDAARALHPVAGQALTVEHWGDALEMGAVAGGNAADPDRRRPWDAVPGFWSDIGEHTIKHASWGTPPATAEVVERIGGFTVWYGDDAGELVGVLTYNADDDYERGEQLLAAGCTVAEALAGRSAPDDEEDA